MHWNNRIFRHVGKDGQTTYALHEAYYPQGMTIPDGWTEQPMCGHFESVKELIDSLSQMLNDARRSQNDVLDYEPKKGKKNAKTKQQPGTKSSVAGKQKARK